MHSRKTMHIQRHGWFLFDVCGACLIRVRFLCIVLKQHTPIHHRVTNKVNVRSEVGMGWGVLFLILSCDVVLYHLAQEGAQWQSTESDGGKRKIFGCGKIHYESLTPAGTSVISLLMKFHFVHVSECKTWNSIM